MAVGLYMDVHVPQAITEQKPGQVHLMRQTE